MSGIMSSTDQTADRAIENATRVLRWWISDGTARPACQLAQAVCDIGVCNRAAKRKDLLRVEEEIRAALLAGCVVETPCTRWQVG